MGQLWRCALGAVVALATMAAQADALTDIERRWLEAAVPVLQFAREQALPLDILVQPQPTPGETPMGMAFVAGRCKLVMSMRGNPEAQATLDRIDPGLVDVVVEAIAAHELAHCWRHLARSWGVVPEGLDDERWRDHVTDDQADLLTRMWRARREEAYADLVGLAWTLKHHPDRYAEVHAWHVHLRATQPVDTGPHDTRLWVHLAQDRQAFGADTSIFEQVRPLWLTGLRAGVQTATLDLPRASPAPPMRRD